MPVQLTVTRCVMLAGATSGTWRRQSRTASVASGKASRRYTAMRWPTLGNGSRVGVFGKKV